MNKLSRVPVWAWFVISLLLSFSLWNPVGFHLWAMTVSDWFSLPVKLMVWTLWLGLVALYALETWRSLGKVGLLVTAVFVAAFIWWLVYRGWIEYGNINTAVWWGPLLLAFVLTLGITANRLYRAATGRVPVSEIGHDA